MKQTTLLATLLASLALPLAPVTLANDAHPLAGVPLRHIGPAITSGRISDFAFHPDRPEIFYAAVASGNLFKTTNDSITWDEDGLVVKPVV